MVQNIVKFITPPAKDRVTTLEISMDACVELSVKEGTRRQRGGEPWSQNVHK